MTTTGSSEETCNDMLDVMEWAEKHLSPQGPKRPHEYGEAAKTAAENLGWAPFEYMERS